MIDPLRYRSLQEQLEFDEDDSPRQCRQCLQERVITPAFFLCHDCGKAGDSRPFCEPCFFDYHLTRRKGKEGHKPHPIVQGDPVTVQTLADGDGTTFAKMHDWVTVDYTLTTDESDVAIEDTFLTKQPLTFQSGCSGPCIHLQLLGCTEIAAADIMGASDPYCAVYWKNEFVGVTTTKHMTLNPTWANQTFVLPLAAEFMAALGDEEGSSTLFNAGALLPKLRIELYDWDRLSKNDFLGQAIVSDAEILRILRQARVSETDKSDTLSFKLEAKQSRGQLGIRVALRGSKLYVHVMQAQNIPKADPFSLSDPYCEVYWNDKRIGKTAHIDDTLDPAWDLEIFSVRVDQDGPNSIEHSTLRVVCFDWDQFGSDDVLGQIELTGPQVKQLAESKDGDEVVSENEGVMGEAEMEKVFDFIRLLQEHEMDEAGLGKLVVGVPQDPDVLRGQDPAKASEGAEVDSPKKKKRKNKRKHGAAESSAQREALRHEAEAEKEKNSSRAQPPEDVGSDENPVRAFVDRGLVGGDKTEPRTGGQAGLAPESQTAEISTEGATHEGGAGGARGQAEGEHPREKGETAGAREEEAGRPSDQARAPTVRMGPSNDADKKGVESESSVSGEVRKRSPDAVRASVDLLNVESPETNAEGTGGDQAVLSEAPPEGENALELGPSEKEKVGRTDARDDGATTTKSYSDTEEQVRDGTQPGSTISLELGADVEAGIAQGRPTRASLDDFNVSLVETEGGNMVGRETMLSKAPRQGVKTLGLTLDKKGPSAQDTTATDDAPSLPQTADVKNGNARSKSSPASAGLRAEKEGIAAARSANAPRYRDANVKRFEENRGVLVEYLDDESSAWVETNFIPRLQIRSDEADARSILQRLWDLRHKVFNLHKQVLNVKRGVKILMGVAMTGSRMQWYPLQLTEEQSGANFVRGTVDCRFLYHTRGSVLRGLDVAVSHMSLGERARVEVRSDYGFGEVYASRNVPPYATLVFVAQVAAIGHRNAKWLVIRRALKDRMDDALFRFRSYLSYLSSAASSYSVARRFAGLLGPLRRSNSADDLTMLDDEEKSFGNPAIAVGEGAVTRTTC